MDRKQTIISSIVQALVAVNAVLMAFGITKFEAVTADQIYTGVSCIAFVVAWAWGLWKNHNFTLDMVVATQLGRKSKTAKKRADLTVMDRMRGEL